MSLSFFETLRDIALMLSKKDSFLSYISTSASDKTAQNLQKKLRLATESRQSSTDNDDDIEVIKRSQSPLTSRFGR